MASISTCPTTSLPTVLSCLRTTSQSLGEMSAEAVRHGASPSRGIPPTNADTAEEPGVGSGGQGEVGGDDAEAVPPTTAARLRHLFPHFSTSMWALGRRRRRHGRKFPPGIERPAYWLKHQGPVKVEAKVWLANQRTFVKWQNIAVLLASLAISLFNAAGKHNSVAHALALIYTCFAAFAAVWGYGVYMWRAKLIRTRSAKDFDNRLGPVVMCGGLAVALILNFAFKLQAALSAKQHSDANRAIFYPHAGEL